MKSKALIGLSGVRKLLLRNCDHVSPETKLALAVIEQTFQDLQSSGYVRLDALNFFKDDRIDLWCELAGINPLFVKEIATKGGFINQKELRA